MKLLPPWSAYTFNEPTYNKVVQKLRESGLLYTSDRILVQNLGIYLCVLQEQECVRWTQPDAMNAWLFYHNGPFYGGPINLEKFREGQNEQ